MKILKVCNPFFISLSFLFIFPSLKAEKYQWNDLTIELPFPKKWLSQRPRKHLKDPLMFLDIEMGKPRIIGRLYHPEYSVTLKSLSDFKKSLLKSKNRWMKENKAKLIKSLTSDFQKTNSSFSYEFMFSTTYGNFLEIGSYALCDRPIAIKILIPEERIKRAQSYGLLKLIRQHQLCSKIR